jgi:hypothetical protein
VNFFCLWISYDNPCSPLSFSPLPLQAHILALSLHDLQVPHYPLAIISPKLESLLEDFYARAIQNVAAFLVQMVQLHLEDGYVVVVEAEAVDLVIVTTKARGWAQDPVIPKKPSNWTYLKFKFSKQELDRERPQENIARKDDCKVVKFFCNSPPLYIWLYMPIIIRLHHEAIVVDVIHIS